MNHLRLDTDQPDRINIWIDVAGRSVNVLSEPVFDELRQCLDEAGRRWPGRPVVLRSAKPKGFVVGADLRRILALETEAETQEFLLYGQETLEHFERFEAATLAFIEGPCLGGGLELALACRFRIACDVPQTKFGMPEAKLGLMPGWGGTQRLIELVGLPAGLQMLLSGEAIDARQAFQIGLVDAIGNELERENVLSRWLQTVEAGSSDSLGRHRRTVVADAEQFDQWQRAHSERISQAQAAILQAVGAGLYHSREAGFCAERDLFFPLLTSPPARQNLQRFVH